MLCIAFSSPFAMVFIGLAGALLTVFIAVVGIAFIPLLIDLVTFFLRLFGV